MTTAIRQQQAVTYTSQVQVARPVPNFTVSAVIAGEMKSVSLQQYRGKYVVLLFYPKAFTFVCPTELIAFNDKLAEFRKLNTEVLGISCDSPEVLLAWTDVSRSKGGLGSDFKMALLSDKTHEVAKNYGVLLPEAGIALRGLFIVSPDGKLLQSTINDLPVGRSTEETIRLIQAFQFVEKNGEVCPASWQPGSATMVADTRKSKKYFEAANKG
jgi:alkyl hydroperoxide reductase subunit AhpC